MNIEQMKAQWGQLKAKAQQRWGQLTNDEITRISGEFDELVATIQKKYGKTKEDARQEVNDWLRQVG